MLEPAIAPRRIRSPSVLVPFAFVAGALVGVAGSLAGWLLAPQRVVVVEARPPAVGAQTSRLSLSLDLIGRDAYQADGARDEVYDVELRSALAVKHIVLHSSGGSQRWDTLIGGAAHLGVRANGVWITSPQTGALGPLPGGTHRLELIATGVSDGCGRSVTVTFVDGTTVTDMVPMTWTASSFPADDGCGTAR